MGEIVLTMQMSLDGVVSEEHKWMTLSEEIFEDYLEYYKTVDTIIVGRNTYASLADHWQQAENSSNSLERAIAQKMNEIPKVVISHSHVALSWRNSELWLVHDNPSLAEKLEARKKRRDGYRLKAGLGHGSPLSNTTYTTNFGCLSIPSSQPQVNVYSPWPDNNNPSD